MARAENVVRDLIVKILEENETKLKNLEIEPITTEGANYTTSLYKLKVDTEDENLDLFAKVALISEEIRKQVKADLFYKTESFVYLNLVKIFEAIQDKNNVSEEHRFVFPKCYGISEEPGKETVVLEDLMAKKYKPYNRFDSMDWDHAAVSVELLAKFHALSFAYNQQNPEEFKELIDSMVHKMGVDDENSDQMLMVWTNMVDRSLSVIDEEHRAKVKDLLMQKEFLDKYNKPDEKPVLCHGDYRLSNILFRRKGKTLQAIPVDYQTVYSGLPPADLVYFMMMGSDEEFRLQHYDRLVDHYYDSLTQALRRLGMDNVEVYPRETFDRHMKESLPYALFIGVAMLPVVTVEAEAAPRMDSEADISTFIVDPNALYASRLQGIVNDCVRWGII